MKDHMQVTKDDFLNFIMNYDKKLERHVTAICEPSVLSFNDFSDGKEFPESMVAYVRLNRSDVMDDANDFYIETV